MLDPANQNPNPPLQEAQKVPSMTFKIQNFVEFFSAISPFLLVFLLFMISVLNQDVKGFIYFLCIVFISFISLFLRDSKLGHNLDASPDGAASRYCNVINFPYNANGNEYIPYFNTIIISFTLFYCLMPMIMTEIYNVPIIMFISFLLLSDIFIKVFKLKCTNLFPGVTLGLILGSILGIGMSMMLWSANMKSLLFFTNLPDGNREVCSMPSTQTFQCDVYKNGQLYTLPSGTDIST